MAELSLKHVYKRYPNGFEAVKDFNLDVADKEFIIFVGPSGCGKSTTLRMIAGLEISEGEFDIDGKRMNDVEPKDRDIAMVFQNYALYPHMTVEKNIAFGLSNCTDNIKDLSSSITENFAIDVAALREQIFNDATANLKTPVDRLNQNERKEIMIKLHEQGLFQLKGSIPFVAKRFSCSQATIYRYLGEINN